MTCPDCGSTSFRTSHFHVSDLSRAARLLFPVRCRGCECRHYAWLFTAFRIRFADHLRHRQHRLAAAHRR